ncbi:MAG: hydrolase [Paucimonas sp.]|nr:hydrolase [Paucimonas sp.]
MDKHLEETCVDSQAVYDGHFLHISRDTVRLPDGKTALREYIRHPGAVVILPLLPDGRILLERQYRYPMHRVFIEFPAGKIDPGEDWLECAKRELAEETGYTAGRWQHVCTIHNAIAYSDEHLQLYLAQDLVPGKASLDEGEFLETMAVTLEELQQWVREGTVTDVKTVIGSFWLEKILSKSWSLD